MEHRHGRLEALEIKDETFDGTFPFAPRYHEVNGFQMHFVDEGQGEPLVLVHGDPTWGYLWRKFIPVLSRRRRCIVPDHMGMGKSGVPREPYPYRLRHHIANLESLLLRLDLRDLTLVLHDWGGPVGLGFAVRHPERIKRLVLMNTWAFAPWPGAPFPRLLEIIRSERGEKFVRLALLCWTRDIPVSGSWAGSRSSLTQPPEAVVSWLLRS